jgi:O-antigen/teichoic acid export membrane protein
MEVREQSLAPRGSLKRRLVSGGAWTLANRMLVTVTQLAALALLARLLSAQDMGVYFLIANLVAVVTVFAQLGLTQSVVRLVAEALATNRLGRARAAINKTLLLGSASAIVVTAMFQLGIGQWLGQTVFQSPLMAALTLWAAIWMLAQTMQRFLDEVFRGLHDLKLAAIFGGMVSGALTVVLLGAMHLVRGSASLEEVLMLQAAAFGAGVVLAALVLKRKIRPLRGEGDIAFSEIMALSWPLFAASMTNIILLRADLWILGMYLPDEEVAVYGAAARIITVVAIPLVMASAILAPMIAELNAKGEKARLERVLRAVATLGGIPALAVILCFIVFGQPLLELIYGEELYRRGWLVLVMLGLAQLVNVWSGVCIQLLMMTGHQKAVMYITLVTSILAILVALVLVQPYGIEGVAFAFACGIALQNVGMVVHSKRKLGVKSYMLANPLALRGLLIDLRATAAQRRQARAAAIG